MSSRRPPFTFYDDGETVAWIDRSEQVFIGIAREGDFEPANLPERVFQQLARAYSEYLGIPLDAFARPDPAAIACQRAESG